MFIAPSFNPPLAAAPARGWAAETFDRAIWQSSTLGLAVWQAAVGALVAWRTPAHDLTIAGLHALVAALTALVVAIPRGAAPRMIFHGALLATFAVDLWLTTDTLATTVLCMTFVVAATPFLVLPWPLATMVTGAAIGLAAALSSFDGGGSRIALATSVPAICFSLAALAIRTSLLRYLDILDAADAAARAEHEHLVAARSSARTIAELSRTLHDTVVNTLAAIAAGGRAVADPERVRRRCADDVHSIESLDTFGRSAARGWSELASSLSLSIEWRGLDEAARDEAIARMCPERQAALRGIVKELLLNVEKHAGTDRAVIDVQRVADELIVQIVDEGRGFAHPAHGHGLSESVFRRGHDAGLHVALSPGAVRGTRATVRCSLTDPADDDPARALRLEQDTRNIRLTATWAWCASVGTASLVSEAVGPGTPGTFAAAGIVAALSLAARWTTASRTLPWWLTLLIVSAVPIVFLLGFFWSHFGGGDPAFWLAIGLSPLLVILLNTGRTWRPLALAVATLASTAAVTSWAVWSRSPEAAGAALAHAAIECMQIGIWLLFVKALHDITKHAQASRLRRLQVEADRAALAGASHVRERWRDAQLQTALELLRDIAEGRCVATDPAVQRRAGDEEQSLRQLLMLNPDLVHAGPWLARAIGRSRVAGIRLTVRTGGRDLPDARSAQAVGSALLRLLDAVPAGTALVVSYFAGEDDSRIRVVGPSGFSRCAQAAAAGGACELRVRALPTQDLLEIHPQGPNLAAQKP